MAGQDGAAERAVDLLLQEFRQAPYKFDFYQAMRLLECAYPEAPRLGRSLRLNDEPVRLCQEPSLRFAPSTLASFESSKNHWQHKLSVHFFGLCGPNGALPLHLTEYIRDRIRHHGDNTFAAFLDIFHHRLLTLFYRAWADAQPTVNYDRPDSDRFSVYVGSLMGIGMPTLRDRDALPDLAKLYYAGRLACQTRHPEGLQAMLADFFNLPVRIDEFVGQWTELPTDCRFRMGDQPESATLGVACTLGSHVWDCQQKFRITIGPIGWDDFVHMFPGGQSLERLTAMVRNYIGDELLWELNLVLKQEETPSWELGSQQLGQSMWLDSAGVQDDPSDVMLHPAAASSSTS
jgi:type VI secretion system protein ImpH